MRVCVWGGGGRSGGFGKGVGWGGGAGGNWSNCGTVHEPVFLNLLHSYTWSLKKWTHLHT